MAHGKKTDQQRIVAAERRQQALALRKAGMAYRAIGDALGVSIKTAHQDVQQALAELAELEHASAAEYRTMELLRLDDLALAAVCILKADHPLVSGGKVLSGITESGKAIGLTDDGPKLAAIDRLLRISERRARLLGLDLQPGAALPGDLDIILRWHDDNRRIIDVTPPADDRHAAAAPSLTDGSRGASGAVQGAGSWPALGEITACLSVMPDDGAE